jgi:hypothetical protein
MNILTHGWVCVSHLRIFVLKELFSKWRKLKTALDRFHG